MGTHIYRIGHITGILAFAANAGFVVVQLLQLMRVLKYPYDEISIYGFSLGIVVPFLLEMLALYHAVAPEKKFWAHAALLFTVIYAVFVTANYVVQLATVIPLTLKGAGSQISMLAQTPHSLFWNFDAIGYIAMGFAMLFAAPVFAKHGFEKWVRISFISHAVVTPLIAVVYFYPNFSERLLLLGLPWGVTAPTAMLLLALMFRQKLRHHSAHAA